MAVDPNEYQGIAAQAAAQYGVPQSLFDWQIGQESGWNPNAQNGSASGIAQFQPATAAQYGVDTSDPASSIFGAAKYDAALYDQYGSWGSVLTHYGTVNASVPQSVLDAANAQLAGVGETPISPGAPANPNAGASPLSPGAAYLGTLGNPNAGASTVLGGLLGGSPVVRIVTVIAGLICILVGVGILGVGDVASELLGEGTTSAKTAVKSAVTAAIV